jgi:hypothetical protein
MYSQQPGPVAKVNDEIITCPFPHLDVSLLAVRRSTIKQRSRIERRTYNASTVSHVLEKCPHAGLVIKQKGEAEHVVKDLAALL